MKSLFQANKIGLMLASLMTVGSVISVGNAPVNAQETGSSSVKRICKRVDGRYYCQKDDQEFSSSNQIFRRDQRRRIDDDRDFDTRFRSRSGRLYKGTTIPTRAFRDDRIEIERGDSRPLNLVVDRDVYSDDTNVLLVPKNSRIEGRLRPDDGGVRYVADSITLPNGRRYNLKARSETIYPRRNANRQISSAATNVLIGSILRQDLRSDSLGNIFSRSQGRSRDRIVKIKPNRDLDLQLTDEFRIR